MHANGRRWIGRLTWATAIVLLTALSQIGGLVLLAVLAILRPLPLRAGRRLLTGIALFAVLHAGLSTWLLPPLAAWQGRTALPCPWSSTAPLVPRNPFYCLANRHYVRPELAALVQRSAADLRRAHPGAVTAYLDGGFPMFDGFPLLPHLSHRDGRSLDLAFPYVRPGHAPSGLLSPSPLGYGAFVPARAGERELCGRRSPEGGDGSDGPTKLHDDALRRLLLLLARHGTTHGLDRIFIEPRLRVRYRLPTSLFRFAGCHAARHDDHLHLSVR